MVNKVNVLKAITNILKVDFISDESNHPTLVFCITGQKKTGCVIGCLRKMSGWSLTSILHEYELFNDQIGRAHV